MLSNKFMKENGFPHFMVIIVGMENTYLLLVDKLTNEKC